MTLEALIFDVDGTLADTEDVHRTSFNQAFEHFRLGWRWERDAYRELLATTGGKERLAIYIASLDLSGAERKRLTEAIPAIHAEKTRLYSASIATGTVPLREGVQRLAEEALAAGCRLAIASTTTAANIDALLQSTLGSRGSEMFSVIACGDQVRAKKPAPDIFNLALSQLGIAPENAVALEDSANGLRAASGCGLWTVVTPNFWSEHDDFSAADLVLPNLGDPDRPLADEPGTQLEDAAWLTHAELARRSNCRPRSGLAAVCAGAM
jgi:beta-phosphoglucomutase-like phosphatase (HAD superfamily)